MTGPLSYAMNAWAWAHGVLPFNCVQKHVSTQCPQYYWLKQRCYACRHWLQFVLQNFFRDLDGWREKHALMNESGSFLIETCDESVVLELEESLLLNNRRWKEICDAVDSFRQTHTSEQRARYMYTLLVSVQSCSFFSLFYFWPRIQWWYKIDHVYMDCGRCALLDIKTTANSLVSLSMRQTHYSIYVIDPSCRHNCIM